MFDNLNNYSKCDQKKPKLRQSVREKIFIHTPLFVFIKTFLDLNAGM